MLHRMHGEWSAIGERTHYVVIDAACLDIDMFLMADVRPCDGNQQVFLVLLPRCSPSAP